MKRHFSDEQGGSVTAYRLNASAGTLEPVQTITTLPDDYTGNNTCSQIQIAASGKFLYAPNRGHNGSGLASDYAQRGMTSLR